MQHTELSTSNLTPDENHINKLLAVAIRNSQGGVIITDHNGLTIWVNESIEKITGYKREEFLNKKPGELLQGKETSESTVQFISDQIKSGKSFKQEILNYSKDGSKMWLNLEIFPLRDELGEISHYVGIQHNISELVDKNEKLENFNYLVSHDLITQANNIKSLTTLLSKKTALQTNKYFILLEKSANRLSNTLIGLKSLLDFKKTKKSYSLPVEKVNVHEIVEKIRETFNTQYDTTRMTLANQIPTNTIVRTNVIYMESILLNLLSNTIRYRHPERDLFVSVEAVSKNGYIDLEISDNGLGMDLESDGDRIFKIFSTFHNHVEGTGLGLYLVKQQVEALGGTITVESYPENGSTFMVSVPEMT